LLQLGGEVLELVGRCLSVPLDAALAARQLDLEVDNVEALEKLEAEKVKVFLLTEGPIHILKEFAFLIHGGQTD